MVVFLLETRWGGRQTVFAVLFQMACAGHWSLARGRAQLAHFVH